MLKYGGREWEEQLITRHGGSNPPIADFFAGYSEEASFMKPSNQTINISFMKPSNQTTDIDFELY